MKKSLFRILILAMSLILCLGGCTNSNQTTTTTASETVTKAETPSPTTPPEDDGKYRILITSDMHYTTLLTYFGTNRDTRLQYWVDGILAEHAKDPFDLIVILGDMSLDYWGYNGGGSYQRSPSVSDTKLFVEKYVSQLPEDVPTLVMPGNHELYTNKKWKEITGNNRNETFVLGNNLFIIPDSYAGAIDPPYQGGGINDAPYKPVDMTFINNALNAHPECDNVFLLSHQFDLNKESTEFRNLLKTETRIVALFSGHSHGKSVSDLGTVYRNLKHLKTGNFAAPSTQTTESFSWGYRDLYITKNGIISRYITPNCEYRINGTKYTVTQRITDTATLKNNIGN